MIIDDSGSDRIRHTFIASIRYQPGKKGQALKQAEKIRASPLGRLRSEEAINPMAAGNNRTAPDATLNLLNGLALVRRATMKSIITPNSLGDQSLYRPQLKAGPKNVHQKNYGTIYVSSVGQNHVVTNDSNRLSQRQNLFIAALAVRRYLQKVSTLFHSYLCKVAHSTG